MAELPLTENALHKSEMGYYGKFGHTIRRIQQIDVMSTLEIGYITCILITQTMASNLPGFQGIKLCAQYLSSQPHGIIFYPSNYYGGSNVIIFTWTENIIEDYTNQNCL